MIFMTCLIMLDYGVFSVIQSVIYSQFMQKKDGVQEWTEKDFVAESIKEPIEAICFVILLYTLDIYSQRNQPSTSASTKLADKSFSTKQLDASQSSMMLTQTLGAESRNSLQSSYAISEMTSEAYDENGQMQRVMLQNLIAGGHANKSAMRGMQEDITDLLYKENEDF